MQVSASISPMLRKNLLEVINPDKMRKPNYYRQIIKRSISTDQLYEEIAHFTGLGPALNTKEAGGVPFREITTPFTKKFFPAQQSIGIELSFQSTFKDQYGVLKSPSKMIGRSLYLGREYNGANIFNFALNAAYTGIDGVSLGSASHPTKTGTQSNVSSSNAALSQEAVEDGVTQMLGYSNYEGDPDPAEPPYWLVVGKEDLVLAKKIFESQQTLGSPIVNDPNVIKDMLAGVIWNPYFNTTGQWALISNENGLFWLQGMTPEYLDDVDARVPSRLFVGFEEFVTGWTKWQDTYWSSGAG